MSSPHSQDHIPQHIRRRCSTTTYDAVESGEKTFELFVGDDIHLEKDDLITLEEWDPVDKKYTGRRITRKLTYVFNTKEAGIPTDELNRYGATICGTMHPDFYSLQSLFNSRFLTGLILETKEGNFPHEVLNGPFYLPPLSTPDFYEMGIYERLSIEKWPIGIYDVMLLIKPDTQRDRFVIIDQRVTGCVYVIDEEDGREQQGIEGVPLSLQALQIGKVRRIDGKELQLADPEEVKKITFIDEEVELPDNLVVTNSLSRGVNEELNALLAEEGFDNVDDNYEEEE